MLYELILERFISSSRHIYVWQKHTRMKNENGKYKNSIKKRLY